MTELALVINVVLMFFGRIGIPLILLVILGVLIDRWQQRLHEEADHYRHKKGPERI